MKYILIFIFVTLTVFSQYFKENKVITGASPGRLDTLKLEQATQNSNESLGLLEKPVDPDKYIIGPGDKFLLTIMSVENTDLRITVSPEGSIFVPGVGKIDVKEKTLNQTYDLIDSQVKKSYPNAEVYCILTDIRKFKGSFTQQCR